MHHLRSLADLLEKLDAYCINATNGNPTPYNGDLRMDGGESTILEDESNTIADHLANMGDVVVEQDGDMIVHAEFHNHIKLDVSALYVEDEFMHFACSIAWYYPIPLYTVSISNFAEMVKLTNELKEVCTKNWSLAENTPIPEYEKVTGAEEAIKALESGMVNIHICLNGVINCYIAKDDTNWNLLLNLSNTKSIPMCNLASVKKEELESIVQSFESISACGWSVTRIHTRIEELRGMIDQIVTEPSDDRDIQQQDDNLCIGMGNFSLFVQISMNASEYCTCTLEELWAQTLYTMKAKNAEDQKKIIQSTYNVFAGSWSATTPLTGSDFLEINIDDDLKTISAFLDKETEGKIVIPLRKGFGYRIIKGSDNFAHYLTFDDGRSYKTDLAGSDSSLELIRNFIIMFSYT